MKAPACLAVLIGNYLLIIFQHAQSFYPYKACVSSLYLASLLGTCYWWPCKMAWGLFPSSSFIISHYWQAVLMVRAELEMCQEQTVQSPLWPEQRLRLQWRKQGLIPELRYTFYCLNFIKALLLCYVPAIWWDLAAAAHLWGAIKKHEILWGDTIFPLISWVCMI